MATILCPTRGGEASVPNQVQAIATAKERAADLIFLYVSDVRFLDRIASPILVDIEAELDELGEFMLTMAQERAEQAGVVAKTLVRRGVFREALKQVIREYDVTVVVLGSAAEGTGVTTAPYLAELTQSLVAETGVEVILLSAGRVSGHFRRTDDAGG